MSIFDWFLFISFLSVVAAASWDDGRFVNTLWFTKIQPAIDEANRISEQQREK